MDNTQLDVNEVIQLQRDKISTLDYQNTLLAAQTKRGDAMVNTLLGVIKELSPEKYAELTKDGDD